MKRFFCFFLFKTLSFLIGNYSPFFGYCWDFFIPFSLNVISRVEGTLPQEFQWIFGPRRKRNINLSYPCEVDSAWTYESIPMPVSGQMFPFRTFIAVLSFITLVIVSKLTEYLFVRHKHFSKLFPENLQLIFTLLFWVKDSMLFL